MRFLSIRILGIIYFIPYKELAMTNLKDRKFMIISIIWVLSFPLVAATAALSQLNTGDANTNQYIKVVEVKTEPALSGIENKKKER
jgi:hypothetical protein